MLTNDEKNYCIACTDYYGYHCLCSLQNSGTLRRIQITPNPLKILIIMKKTISVILLLVAMAMIISSCATRELCPAYSKAEKKAATEKRV